MVDTSSGAGRSAPADEAEIAELRTQLDAINLQLLQTLEARGRLVRKIMVVKRRIGRSTHDPARERDMMAALLAKASDIYPAAGLEQIFGAIFAASRALGLEATTDDGDR
jgi:chorismate mutase